MLLGDVLRRRIVDLWWVVTGITLFSTTKTPRVLGRNNLARLFLPSLAFTSRRRCGMVVAELPSLIVEGWPAVPLQTLAQKSLASRAFPIYYTKEKMPSITTIIYKRYAWIFVSPCTNIVIVGYIIINGRSAFGSREVPVSMLWGSSVSRKCWV